MMWIVLGILIYLAGAFLFGVVLGKTIRMGRDNDG